MSRLLNQVEDLLRQCGIGKRECFGIRSGHVSFGNIGSMDLLRGLE